MINEDLRCRGLSLLARCLFAQLAAMANTGGGYIMIGTLAVTLERAASSIGFDAPLAEYVREIMAMGLLSEDDIGWFVPEMRAAQILREKRTKAGRAGGEATTANRTDVAANQNRNADGPEKPAAYPRARPFHFCSSKPETIGNVRVFSEGAKKEKRKKKKEPKKKKIINIYISSARKFS